MRPPVVTALTTLTFGVIAASLGFAHKQNEEGNILASAPAGTQSAGSLSSSSSLGASSDIPEDSVADTGTYLGDAVNTEFGPVQVEIAVENGTLVDAQAVRYPDNNEKDRRINERAIPSLNADAIEKQSADVDMVGGATYTSLGYRQSLQSALDQVNP